MAQFKPISPYPPRDYIVELPKQWLNWHPVGISSKGLGENKMTVYNYIIVSLKDGEADAVIASGTLIARSEESARAKASVTHADGLVSLDDFNVIVRKF